MTPALPHAHAYWAVPGRVVAGEYPGAATPDAARAKVQAHLAAGVRTFVDLTEPGELAPYAGVLAQEAARLGVRAAHLRFAVPDAGVPGDAGLMAAALDAIERAAERDPTVYVHCWGGVGRTGTVVGCLLRRRGLTGDAALAEVARLFATTAKAGRHRGSPETPAQADYVRRWPAGA